MSDDQVLRRAEGPVGHLVFSNPAKRNAISAKMWREAVEGLDAFAADPAIRVLVISGAAKSFIPGADIGAFDEGDTGRGSRTPDLVTGFPKPSIAMIDGWCLGAGMAIALSCDLRIATPESKFGIPAAKLGLGYGAWGVRPLMTLVGVAAAKEILYTGRQFSAQEAREMGLVNRLVPADRLEADIGELAGSIAANAPLSVAAAKRTIDELSKDPAERDMAGCEALIAQCRSSADFAEGRKAFLEKRKPVFTGR